MGNQPSQTVEYAISEDELSYAPHNFYLVFGKPSIQYTRGRLRGPLIYDVQVEYDDEEDVVEHTTTLDLNCAVPRRQKFQLISTPPQQSTLPHVGGGATDHHAQAVGTPHNRGLALAFRIAATEPPKRVRVLTGVSLKYRPGSGIQLISGDPSSRHPRCVFNTDATAGLETVVTRPEIFPQHLQPVKLEDALEATGPITAQRVAYAPLVIEMVIGETDSPLPSSNRPATADKPEESAAHLSPRSPLHSPPRSLPSPPPSPAKKRIVQYTLLELPAEANEALPPTREADTTPPVRLTCRVCKQLLQVGSEVYDLEDVFDVGRDDEEATNPLVDPGEDDDLCVVCLTNPKDTTILPCRHMCLCSECATHLRLSNNRCPLCRGNIDRLMTI